MASLGRSEGGAWKEVNAKQGNGKQAREGQMLLTSGEKPKGEVQTPV